jgi:hypothetical protein
VVEQCRCGSAVLACMLLNMIWDECTSTRSAAVHVLPQVLVGRVAMAAFYATCQWEVRLQLPQQHPSCLQCCGNLSC